MNTKNLALIIALATAGTLNLTSLNAAEPALAPQVKACHTPAAAVTTSDASLATPSYTVAASPKVFASFPYLASGHKAQPAKPMTACSCCKP
jgi:hypothetical protein